MDPIALLWLVTGLLIGYRIRAVADDDATDPGDRRG